MSTLTSLARSLTFAPREPHQAAGTHARVCTHTHTHVSHGRLRLSVRTGIMELFNGTTEQITPQKTGGVISSPGSPRGKRAVEAPSFLLRAPAQEPRLVLLATWKVKRSAQRRVSNSSGSHTRSLAPGLGGPQIAEARTGKRAAGLRAECGQAARATATRGAEGGVLKLSRLCELRADGARREAPACEDAPPGLLTGWVSPCLFCDESDFGTRSAPES